MPRKRRGDHADELHAHGHQSEHHEGLAVDLGDVLGDRRVDGQAPLPLDLNGVPKEGHAPDDGEQHFGDGVYWLARCLFEHPATCEVRQCGQKEQTHRLEPQGTGPGQRGNTSKRGSAHQHKCPANTCISTLRHHTLPDRGPI